MRDTIKLEKTKLETTHKFSINYHWKRYDNLSIEINNYRNKINLLWVQIDHRLEKLSNFKKIEQKIFKNIAKSFKKQMRNSILTLNI